MILRGQTGTDLNEVMHGAGDPVAAGRAGDGQRRGAARRGRRRLTDVVKATVFVTDRAFLPGVTDVVLRQLDSVTPCFSALVVKGLASPDLLMEVDITAATSG